ncbi:MAG: HPr family phosphocarrier protein [Candidatus Omnitrophota bacterium]
MTESKKTAKPFIEQKIVISNKLGLHARPAALFVQTANRYRSKVEVRKGKEKVNGKSIMGIMTLAAGVGDSIAIRAEGEDAEEMMKALIQLIESQFGE